ncbi:DMT family transporter [Pseudidiomarina insulisalsae]|uniref:EamA family transporter n=1 Tax=Pseudidiomarina insulisalsae TaxID=575789 RepID=A0A432YQ74_9GAMM|nr:EamA family transporter [Pseudidiomarina insulisalsae]RUO63212.1 EamA family transporter [Pseudidiomarina insulisalsae]
MLPDSTLDQQAPLTRFGTLLVALAALCWGISGGIGGLLLAAGWEPFVVAFYRGVIGLFFVALWLALTSSKRGLVNPRLWLWSALAGIGVTGNFVFYFISIRHGSVAVAATLMYCAPIFVYLVSFLLGLEKSTWIKWFAIAVVMIGIVLLTGVYQGLTSAISTWGIVAGLLSGLSYALFIFGFKYAAPHGSPQAVLVVAFAVLALLLVGLADTQQVVQVVNSNDWLLFAALGVLGAGISFVIYVIGLNVTAPAVASVVAMIEPVTASLFGVALLNERLNAMQLTGMVLILITVTGLSVFTNSGWVSSLRRVARRR